LGSQPHLTVTARRRGRAGGWLLAVDPRTAGKKSDIDETPEVDIEEILAGNIEEIARSVALDPGFCCISAGRRLCPGLHPYIGPGPCPYRVHRQP
jgi:hypothetical protein